MTLLVIISAAILFFALIMASIALHELGHLIPAKIFGVKVTQYFVGFGRTLWSRRWGGTEYGFKLIPLGGYVRMIGMYPPAAARPARVGPVTRLADAARAVEYEEITPEDDGRLFYQKKTWQKLIIMAGGPLMNVLLALLIIGGVNALHGQYRPQLEVAAVSECVVPQARAGTGCQAGDPVAPASRMGFQKGDRVVSFNGTSVQSWDEFSTLIRENADRPATVVVIRDGQQVTLATVPTMVTGVPDRLNPSRRIQAGFLGVSPTHQLVRTGPLGTAEDVWTMTRQSVVGLVNFPVKVWNVAADLVTGKPRDANGPLSIVGASRVAGEIAAAEKLTVGERVASWFMMLGAVNLFVALLNLVPLPPLDGGHMAGALWEAARRGMSRLAGRPDPGPVDTARMLPIAYAVGGFLVLAGAVLILADMISPIKIF